MNDKISAKHLERAAYVYIRQSTLQQVRQNLESGRRQYALQDRARQMDQLFAIDAQARASVLGVRLSFKPTALPQRRDPKACSVAFGDIPVRVFVPMSEFIPLSA